MLCSTRPLTWQQVDEHCYNLIHGAEHKAAAPHEKGPRQGTLKDERTRQGRSEGDDEWREGARVMA